MSFSLVRSITTAEDATFSRITDLVIMPDGGMLYSTTRFDGEIAAWEINGGRLSKIDQDSFASGAIPGAQPGLTFVTTGGMLLSGGGAGNQMTLLTLADDGSFQSETSLGSASQIAGTLVQPMSYTLTDGSTVVFGGVQGGDGLAQLVFDTNGQLQSSSIIPDTGSVSLQNTSAIASRQFDNAGFIFTAGQGDLGLTAWEVSDTTGALTARDTLTTDDGLWINGPSAMTTATAGGGAYVILASSGSSSLSVVSTSSGGQLAITSHIIDDRNTRFSEVIALTSVIHNGQSYIIVGGADDGITVFLLLPGGILQHQGSFADTPDMTLANVSAIAAQSRGSGLDLFVASGTEPGLTQLRFDISPDRDVLTGTDGADHLDGGAGDDILLDLAGRDTLTGGAGADVFILSADGDADMITDFTVGIDKVDLAGWANLRSIDQLYFDSTANGIIITYGDETLTLFSSDGGSIAANDLSEADLIGPARLPPVAEEGTPGPVTDPPPLPDRPILPPPTPDDPPEPEPLEQFGTEANDVLIGGAGNDLLFGQSGDDRLTGADGADFLFGGTGNDSLFGQAGDDQLYGGAGRDTQWHSTGADRQIDKLYGGADNDTLWGLAGADTLDGGDGNDVLHGGGGRDTFIFRSGTDTITDFIAPVDRLQLDDALWQGTLNAPQIITQFARVTGNNTVFDFGGDHILTLEDWSDLAALSDRIDII